MTGRKVGSWVLEEELGRGGMGSVYKARHASLSTLAAVKVLSPGLESEESFRQRFHREASLQAQLRHPNVARVLDYLEDAGHWFLVVEYLERGSLADVLSREGVKVPRPQAIAWACQALAGLGYAHQKGIVHRDVKPANLLLNESGEVVVADFGIARADNTPGLTTTGIAVGTPQYMSPEQILTPDRIDRRTDIYSLGVVFYELLTGRRPFDSGSQFSVLQAHVSEPPPPPRSLDPGIAPALEIMVLRALAKRPEDRYPDCGAMIRDLDQLAALPEGTRTVGVLSGVVDATVRSSSLLPPAPAPALALGPAPVSPAERRDQRRRSLQRRILIGTLAVCAIAALLALRLGNLSNSPGPDPTPVPTPTPAPAPPPTPTPPSPVPPILDPTPIHTGTSGPPPVPTPAPDPDPEPVISEAPPVPSGPVLPERPRIAVLATGDPLLAGALEQEMERRLGRRFEVADEHGDPEVDELLAREGAGVSHRTLGETLLRSNFQVLVLLRVEEAKSQTVEALGISGTLKAARMRMNAYLLPANRSVGRGWTEPVEYTELSAANKAKQAFIGPTADLIPAIDQEWTDLRAAVPAR